MTDKGKFSPERPRMKRSEKLVSRSLEEEQDEADRQTRGLAGLALLLGLLIISLFVVHRLFDASANQDCIMEGRANCGVITVTAANPDRP